jgi:hypothetical protein
MKWLTSWNQSFQLLSLLASQFSCSITFWASFSRDPFTRRTCTMAYRTGDQPIFITLKVLSGHKIPPIYESSMYVILIAFLPPFLLFSPSSSSRLMPPRSVAASTLDGFSTGTLFSTHILSSHLLLVNSIVRTAVLCGVSGNYWKSWHNTTLKERVWKSRI